MEFWSSSSGANPMIVSYNATSSLVHFETKTIFLCLEKTLLHNTTMALYLVVNTDVVGLAPGIRCHRPNPARVSGILNSIAVIEMT
jgi:hypothetical protein